MPQIEVDPEVRRLAELKAKLTPEELAWRERIARLELSDYSGFSPQQVLGEGALQEALQPAAGPRAAPHPPPSPCAAPEHSPVPTYAKERGQREHP